MVSIKNKLVIEEDILDIKNIIDIRDVDDIKSFNINNIIDEVKVLFNSLSYINENDNNNIYNILLGDDCFILSYDIPKTTIGNNARRYLLDRLNIYAIYLNRSVYLLPNNQEILTYIRNTFNSIPNSDMTIMQNNIIKESSYNKTIMLKFSNNYDNGLQRISNQIDTKINHINTKINNGDLRGVRRSIKSQYINFYKFLARVRIYGGDKNIWNTIVNISQKLDNSYSLYQNYLLKNKKGR